MNHLYHLEKRHPLSISSPQKDTHEQALPLYLSLFLRTNKLYAVSMDWPFVSEFFHLACFFFQDSSMYLIAFYSWIILCCMDILHLICLCIAWRAIWVVSTFWLIWIILLWLEKEMATHSSVLAWRIPWTGEPGGLLSMG